MNEARDVIKCQYLSEPIVAEASAHRCLLALDKEEQKIDLLPTLADCLTQQHVTAGPLGEVVATKIVLDAMDKCVGRSVRHPTIFESEPVTLLNLLKVLISSEEHNRIAKGA